MGRPRCRSFLFVGSVVCLSYDVEKPITTFLGAARVSGVLTPIFPLEKETNFPPLTDYRYLYAFQRYSWSNLKVVLNRTKFWIFSVF